MRRRLTLILAIVAFLGGASLVSYPYVSDFAYKQAQSKVTWNQEQAVTSLPQDDLSVERQRAYDYNEWLLSGKTVVTDPFDPSQKSVGKDEYLPLLNVLGDGVMGSISIPKLDLDKVPIYHGTSDEVLQKGAGHLEGTSLPVGGDSTHAVISGHRGLPRAKLFTNLDRLTEGDTFTITVLDQTITYEVDQIRVVLPEDLSELEIVRGADLFTLITCTPYGINTHRLLVRGHRIDNIIGADVVVADAIPIPRYIAVPAVGVPILFLFLLCMLVYYRTRPTVSMEKATEALRQKVRSGANNGYNGSGNEGSEYGSSGKGQRR